MTFCPRTRTGMGISKGGLIENQYQHWKVQLLHPYKQGDKVLPMKIEVSSCMKSKGTTKASDYVSLRFEDLTSTKTFFIGLLLAMREYVKYSPHENIADFKRYIEKVPDMVLSGHYDSQIQVYGYGGAKK